MCADTPQSEARVARYRQLRSLTRSGAAKGQLLLDRYARAVLRRAEAAQEVTAKGLQRLECLCDLNEAGLLDYRGRGPDGIRYTLSRAGRAVLAAAPPRRSLAHA